MVIETTQILAYDSIRCLYQFSTKRFFIYLVGLALFSAFLKCRRPHGSLWVLGKRCFVASNSVALQMSGWFRGFSPTANHTSHVVEAHYPLDYRLKVKPSKRTVKSTSLLLNRANLEETKKRVTIQTDHLRWVQEIPGCWIERQEFSHNQSGRCGYQLASNSLYCWLSSFLGQMALLGIYIHLMHSCGFPSFFLNSTDCWESTSLGVEEYFPNVRLLGADIRVRWVITPFYSDQWVARKLLSQIVIVNRDKWPQIIVHYQPPSMHQHLLHTHNNKGMETCNMWVAANDGTKTVVINVQGDFLNDPFLISLLII